MSSSPCRPSGGAVRRNSLRYAPFGPPTVSCVLAPARTCLRQAPPTSRGRGVATSAVLHHLTTNDIVLSQCFPAMSYVSVIGHACMALTMLQGHLTWQRMPFTWWFCHTKMSQMHLHDHVAYPARGILQSSSRGESHHKRLRSYVLTCFISRDDATAPSVTH